MSRGNQRANSMCVHTRLTPRLLKCCSPPPLQVRDGFRTENHSSNFQHVLHWCQAYVFGPDWITVVEFHQRQHLYKATCHPYRPLRLELCSKKDWVNMLFSCYSYRFPRNWLEICAHMMGIAFIYVLHCSLHLLNQASFIWHSLSLPLAEPLTYSHTQALLAWTISKSSKLGAWLVIFFSKMTNQRPADVSLGQQNVDENFSLKVLHPEGLAPIC